MSKSSGYTTEVDELDWRKTKKWWQCPWFELPNKYKISYKSTQKLRWDTLIVLLAIYNSLIIPFE